MKKYGKQWSDWLLVLCKYKFLSARFDYIFIDTPPVNVVTDAAALSRFINGVVIVTRYRISTSDSTKAALNTLKQAGAEILGFILNDITSEYSNYSRYRYKYYHEYEYGDPTSESK